jgi:hypothetical protein
MNSEQIQGSQKVIIKYSFNQRISLSDSKTEAAKKTWGWQLTEVEWSEEALTRMVKNHSYLPSKLSDGHKVIKSVEEVYFIPLDFDSGSPSVDEFKKIASKWQFSWFLHTTSSHQKPRKDEAGNSLPGIDKFRVIIPLSKPVTRKELLSMTPFWIDKFPSIDESCLQGERFYYRSENAKVYLHNVTDQFDTGIPVFLSPDKILEDLIILKSQSSKSKEKSKSGNQLFDLNTELILADGKTIISVRDIKEHTAIFCPFCEHDEEHRSNPNSANAFVNINSAGQYYIYCSSESKTYWQDPEQINPNKSEIFWNTSFGCPSAINYKTVYDESAYYVFKNDADFRSYCRHKKINPEIKEYLPRREIIFDPSLEGGLTEEYFNVFEESEYMKKDHGVKRIPMEELMSTLHNKTPFIMKIMTNVFGEDEYISRFLNWCAYILQARKKVDTAWLITSEAQGVGKDLIFNRILRPLFGEKQSQLLDGKEIGTRFNSQDVNCFLRGYNEVFTAGDHKTNNARKEWLKNKITGIEHSIEFKGVDMMQARNFMNIILFSNNRHSVLLDKEDRRFNVIRNEKAKKIQELPFFTKKSDLEPSISAELDEFAKIIFTLEYDEDDANTAMDTRAKSDLIECCLDPYEAFALALKDKDADFFLFDEIFPVSSGDKMLNQRDISPEAEELILAVKTKGVIISKYMSKVTGYHFQRTSYRSVLNRLKLKGVANKPVRFGEGDVRKGYAYIN